MCSGTDCPILVAKAFRRSSLDVIGVADEFEQTFLCELKPQKRQFCRVMFAERPKHFDDVRKLGGKFAHDWVNKGDASRQPLVAIPTDSTELWAGIPCQDVSRSSGHAFKALRGCTCSLL